MNTMYDDGIDIEDLEAHYPEFFDDYDYDYDFDDGDMDVAEVEADYDDIERWIRRRRPRRGPRRRPIRRPIGGRPFGGRPRPGGGSSNVALTQLTTDVAQIKTRLSTVDRGIATNRSRLDQQNEVNVAQTRKVAALQKKVDQQSQMALLMSLLEDDTVEYTIVAAEQDEAVGQKVTLKSETDTLSLLLPMLLSGGLGGASGDNSNDSLMLAMVLALSKD